jgi:hypothetical protein
MASGTVKWFNATKGYGFIQPTGGGKDVCPYFGSREGWSVHRQQIQYQEKRTQTGLRITRVNGLGRGDDLRIEGIPNGRQIRFKADFWRVGFGRRSTSG